MAMNLLQTNSKGTPSITASLDIDVIQQAKDVYFSYIV